MTKKKETWEINVNECGNGSQQKGGISYRQKERLKNGEYASETYLFCVYVFQRDRKGKGR